MVEYPAEAYDVCGWRVFRCVKKASMSWQREFSVNVHDQNFPIGEIVGLGVEGILR